MQIEDESGARKKFEAALKLDPSNVGALGDLSLLLLLAGDDRLAATHAAKLLAISPFDEHGLVVEAIALVNLGSNERAVRLLSRPQFRSIRQRDPLLSAAFISALRACSSAPACKAVNQSDSSSGIPRAQLQDVLFAGQSFRASNLQEVLNGWIGDLDRDPNVARQDIGRVLTIVGQADLFRGSPTEAEVRLTRAIELEPCNFPARVVLSQVQRSRGAIPDSDTNLYRIKRCAPSSEPDGLRLADEFMRLKMFVDARDVLQGLRTAGYRDERLLYLEGLCQFRVGDSDAAEKSFRQALVIDPTSLESKTGLAVVMLATSRGDSGAALLEEIVASGKATAQVYFYLADQERGKGNLKRAEELLAAAIQIAPKDARPYAALGRLHTQEGKWQEAENDLQQAVRLDSSSETAHYYLATLYRKEGKQTGAGDEMRLFRKLHEEERNRGIVGLQVSDVWEYPGFLPSGQDTQTPP